MAETTDVASLTYELMKKMRAEQQEMRLELMDVKMRLSALEDHTRGVMTNLVGLNARGDRVDERLGRIERRLELRGGVDDGDA